MKTTKITPVILAGGKGTRLWPLSREDTPKQFCNLREGLSLFQTTVERVQNTDIFDAPIIVTGSAYIETVKQQLKDISAVASALISEPVGKDTSAAILLAIEVGKNDQPFLVMPSDHLIADELAFRQAVEDATASAIQVGMIVTFGIKPTHPDTGFGYIRAGKAFYDRPVLQLTNFIEKPDFQTASELITQPNIFWNAGIFLFDPRIVRSEFKKLSKKVFNSIVKATAHGSWDGRVFNPEPLEFTACPAVSFDYAIMENTTRAATIPVNPRWSDLGSWKAVWETSSRDDADNVVGENCYVENSSDCLVRSDGPTVGVANLSDIVVVASKDAILVTSRSNPQGVKPLVKSMKREDVSAATRHPDKTHSWGRSDSLDVGDDHKVKRIQIHPRQGLSSHYHHHRAEHWIVVSGVATVTLDEKVITLPAGQQISIPQGVVHRLDNFTDETIEIIEVLIGHYLGDDDIVHVEDINGVITSVSELIKAA